MSKFYESLLQRRRDILTKYRLFIYKINLKDVKLGKGSWVDAHVHFTRKHKVVGGKNLVISRYAHFGSHVQLGDNVLVGSFAAFVGGGHKFDGIGDLPIRHAGIEEFKLTIVEDGAWIGHGSIIMNGVKIGKGAIVAAGSIVTKDVPPDTIVGNGYAKAIRKRIP